MFPHIGFIFSLNGCPEIFSNASDYVFKFSGNVVLLRLNIACHLAREVTLLVLWPLECAESVIKYLKREWAM